MTPSGSSDACRSDQNLVNEELGQIVADYIRACQQGAAPDRQEIVRAHPELAAELEAFFQDRDDLAPFVAALERTPRRPLNIRCPHCFDSVEHACDNGTVDIVCRSCGKNFSLSGVPDWRAHDRLGQFELLEQVGEGQFGVVWKARDITLNRIVAIKIPRRRDSRDSDIEMFLRDARVAAQISHPQIVSVHEVGIYNDTIYIASDFIEGISLRDYLRAHRFSMRDAVELICVIAQAVHFAHELGIVHRDLKPGNIMLDTSRVPHLVDFGLAKYRLGELTITVTGQILGTPAYMAPEQARGEGHRVDRTADVYSLGVILYELITGHVPFRGEVQVVLPQIILDPPTPPTKLNQNIPRDLETICLKCLEKEPSQRYPTALALAEDCQRFLSGASIAARPISLTQKAYRLGKRNRLASSLIGLVVGLVVVAAAVGWRGFQNTRAALAVAQQHAERNEQLLYTADMHRAGIASREINGMGEVRRILAHWNSAQVLADRRGWEWHYLHRLSSGHPQTVNHSGGVAALAFSPDGNWLSSAGFDQRLRIWSRNGKFRVLGHRHRGRITDLMWDPQSRFLATASEDATVQIWKSDAEQPLQSLDHGGPVTGLTFSPDGAWLATASQSRSSLDSPTNSATATVSIWNTMTWRTSQIVPLEGVSVEMLRWHPRLPEVTIAQKSGPLATLNVETSQVRFADDLNRRIHRIAWNKDGSRLAATAREIPGLSIHDERGALLSRHGPTHNASQLAWHPQLNQLTIVNGDKEVQLFDLDRDQQTEPWRGHGRRITSLGWHPQGKRFATAAMDGEIKVWSGDHDTRLAPGSAAIDWHPRHPIYLSRVGASAVIVRPEVSSEPQFLPPHATDIVAAAWSPTGNAFAVISYDGLLRVHQAESGELIWQSQRDLAPPGGLLSRLIDWSPQGNRLALRQGTTDVVILDATQGDLLATLKTGFADVVTLAWHPHRNQIAVGGDTGCRIFDVESGQMHHSLERVGRVSCVEWQSAGHQLALSVAEQGLAILNADQKSPPQWLLGHRTYVHCVAWHPSGQRLASSDEMGDVCLFDVPSGQLVLTLKHPGAVPALSWSADGQALAATGFGGARTVQIWRADEDRSESDLW